MESKITTGNINIGIVNDEGNFKLCELIAQDIAPGVLANYVKIDGKLCSAKVKKLPPGQLYTDDVLTFEKPNSNLVIACLESFNILHIDDHDLLLQLIPHIPNNIHTIVFGKNIQKFVKFELSNNIKNIISCTDYIYCNKFNVSKCYLVSDDFTAVNNFIKTNLKTNELILYYIGKYSNKYVINIPIGTNKFVLDSREYVYTPTNEKISLNIVYDIPDSLNYLISHSNIKNINRIPRNCIVKGEIPNSLFEHIDLRQHLDFFIAYTDLNPILINNTYYLIGSDYHQNILIGPCYHQNILLDNSNTRFIKIEFTEDNANISSSNHYPNLRSLLADRYTILSSESNV